MQFIKQNLKAYYRFLLPVGVIFLYIFPLIWYGQDSHILIHDNLDSNIISLKVLSESGQIFGALDAVIPNIMNGLPRNVYGSGLKVMNWLFYFFEPFNAYVINQVLMRYIAFLGMYLLLKKHFMKENQSEWVAIGVALTFSLLPFWPSGGLSVAGQPLAFYAFLNFRDGRQGLKDWLIICFIPFYASLVLSYTFFLIAVSLIWLYDWVIGRSFNTKLFMAIALMSAVFLVVEYRLVYSIFFDSNFVSHRSDWALTGHGLTESVKRSWSIFRSGQYHAHSMHQYLISLSVLMTVTVALSKSLRIRLIILLIVIIAVISGIYGFWGWKALVPLRESIGIFSSFQFTRFHFLQPLLWYIVFALSLKTFYEHIPKYGRNIVIGFIILQSLFLFYHHDQIQQRTKPTFRQFYSKELFQEIDEYIGEVKKSYRVVSIGMHPSVSQYNGFYTLDGYRANYPLEYKQQFRKVIEQELEKNSSIRDYFDNWGNRCYVFTDELGRSSMVRKDSGLIIENLELNTDVLYEIGGRYIFSAVEIVNSVDNNLVMLDIFESEISPWRIHLYKVIEP